MILIGMMMILMINLIVMIMVLLMMGFAKACIHATQGARTAPPIYVIFRIEFSLSCYLFLRFQRRNCI